MIRPNARAGLGFAVVALLVLVFPSVSPAQQAKVSFRVTPTGPQSGSPLFNIDIVEPSTTRRVALPSFTVMKTDTGPRLTNLALLLPEMTIGSTVVASRIGDQPLPRPIVSTPLSGSLTKQPLRGLSFSTAGATPWSFSVGQLGASDRPSALSSDAPGIMALAVGLTPHERISVAPRLLVPVGGHDGTQTSIGTAVRAEVNPHLAFVSDVGAANTADSRWSPLAAAGLIGQWSRTNVETNVVRGARGPNLQPGTSSFVDRESARAQLQLVSGVTLTGVASWSRSQGVAAPSETATQSVGIVYDRLGYGQLAATGQRELTLNGEVETARVEWRQAALRGFVVRYKEQRLPAADTPQLADSARQFEVDFPGWTGADPDTRLNVQAAVKADPSSPAPVLTSRLRGQFDVFGDVGLRGESELALTGTGGHSLLRALRVSSEVPMREDTALQLLYTYRSGLPFRFDQSFEARVSRTIRLFRW